MALMGPLIAKVHNSRRAAVRTKGTVLPPDRGQMVDSRLLIREGFEKVIQAGELFHHGNAPYSLNHRAFFLWVKHVYNHQCLDMDEPECAIFPRKKRSRAIAMLEHTGSNIIRRAGIEDTALLVCKNVNKKHCGFLEINLLDALRRQSLI